LRSTNAAVIKRVFGGGRDIEKEEIRHFYKSDQIKNALDETKCKPYTIYKIKKIHNAIL
jgi:predicted ABC-type ATPase